MTYRVAVTSSDGNNVDTHFGQASRFLIVDIDLESGTWTKLESRPLAEQAGSTVSGCAGHDDARLDTVVRLLADCPFLLTAKIGIRPYKRLQKAGINPLESPFDLDEAFRKLNAYKKRGPGRVRESVPEEANERTTRDGKISSIPKLYPDFFNDVFGPIMQPGSSGGFAGPCRIGNLARSLVRADPVRIRFLFNPDGKNLGHLSTFMTDRGYLGGSLGFRTDDIRLFDAHEIARSRKISYDFDYLESANEYPDSVTVEIEDAGGNRGAIVAASIGGGMIRVWEIDGFGVSWQSDTYGLLVEGVGTGADSGNIDALEAELGDAIVRKRRVSDSDGAQGIFIELSSAPDASLLERCLRAARYTVLPALLPVVTTREKKPQLFRTVAEWRDYAERSGISFAQAAIRYEQNSSGWGEKRIWDFFRDITAILREQIHSLEKTGYENAVDTPMLPIYGKLWNRYVSSRGPIADDLTSHIIAHAFSTNAKIPGVRIVPGPMGTGGGYLFSALDAVYDAGNYTEERLLESLAVAAALGAIAFTHTNASGEVGCAGESGVCCAMASGAVAWLVGGTGEQVENAASMALQANIGIPCDPIPGGKEFPCITRTVRAAVTAPLYADMALCGMDPLIPYHEVLQAIEHNFRTTDREKLCGARCGCNITGTARECSRELEQGTVEDLHFHAVTQ